MARPGFISHVLYRRTTDFTFDLEYYNAYHIPLCLKLWEPRGVVEHYVTQMTDSQAELAYLITMVWKDEECFKAAYSVESEIKEIMDDVPKFTNAKPESVVGKIVG